MGLGESSSTQDGGDEEAGDRKHIDDQKKQYKVSWFGDKTR